MRKLTREEMNKLILKKGTATTVRTMCMKMKVGEILLVEPKDWNQKRSPAEMLRRLGIKTGMKFEVTEDDGGAGWVVVRIG